MVYKLYQIQMKNQSQESVAAKQAYLRDHVPHQKYEDFGQFCESEAGNLDIENWSLGYIKSLVQKFIRSEAERETSNLKKQHQSFFSYQTGNAKQMKQLRQQLKQEPKPAKQQQKAKTPELTKTKTQQSALQLLDSIFSNPVPNESQFDSKKYDKAFFQSCNFWGAPADQPSSSATSKQGSPTTGKPQNGSVKPIANFQKVFQTGINLPSAAQQKIEKKVDKPIMGHSPIKETREWKLVQIPIQDDEPKPAKGKQFKYIPTEEGKQQKLPNQQKENNGEKKSTIKLKSVKNIKVNKVPYEGEILIKQPFKTTVACFRSLQRIGLSSKDLKVTIESHEIITRSFFSSNYVMYHLRIVPSNMLCKRNYQDFQKLKNNLEAVYPGIRLPYLQKAGWLQSETTPQFISKQKKYLLFFLEDVMSHPQLRNSRILQDFLTLRDHKAIKRKFEEYQKIKKVTSIEQLCLLQGEVKVQISEQNRQYGQLLQGLLYKMNVFWDSQQKILVQINSMYSGLVQNYKRWNETVQQIKKEVKQFNKHVNFNELMSMQSALDDLSRYTAECGNYNVIQMQFIQSNISPLFFYQRQNMNLLNSILTLQGSMTRQYMRRKQFQKSQDNTEYLSQRLKDYKQKVLEESSNITVFKHQCGYINSLAVSEGHRYFDRLSKKIVLLVSDVCYDKLKKANAVYKYLY